MNKNTETAILPAVFSTSVLFCFLVLSGIPIHVFAENELANSGSAAITVEDGWEKGGNVPFLYEVGKDKDTYHTKSPSYYITSGGWPEGWGMLMKRLDAKRFRGNRVRMRAYVKTDSVAEWAGLWMRVDGRDQNDRLGFDNMHNRPIRETTDWQQYEIVLDAPYRATNIVFGLLLMGPGKAWLDDVRFDIVGP